jgi:hypothetical protein
VSKMSKNCRSARTGLNRDQGGISRNSKAPCRQPGFGLCFATPSVSGIIRRVVATVLKANNVPRISSEAQFAAAFRPQPQPLPVPKGLQPARARAIWREITASKPADYFLIADTPLLTRLCTLCARAEGLEQLIAVTPLESEKSPRLERRLVSISAALTSLASKLRLTGSHRIERHAAARSSEAERHPRPWDPELIGGWATRPRHQ